ncbi:Eukaryotic translation initiation factor 5A-1 [Clydaea vesicula]|uniref:Eukaryotic translation initiation factor 5A-1 n=1 Tax=Clydaea vesicula TaxID=447962 RepID=A0AAD5XT49_9FUNG|nr:Eukaryotic translation initiation factor 5A-1 [Clydaea vesicula]
MPKLIAKIEGRGNGIKTVIVNMSNISRALMRPPAYATKFFGIELGVQSNCDDKVDKYLINGAHEQEKLAEVLDLFIKKYVLCSGCLNPETDFIIEKKKKSFDIKTDCKACVKDETNDDNAEGEEDGEQDGDDALTKQIFEEAERLKDIKLEKSGQGDEQDWAVDMSEEAVAARQKELSSAVIEKMMATEDEPEKDPLDIFAEFVSADPRPSDEAIREEANRLEIRDDKAVAILFQILFEKKLDAKVVKKNKSLLSLFLTSEKCQLGFLGGFERIVGQVLTDLLNEKDIPLLLKLFYDEDLVEEESFLAWSEKSSKKYVKKSLNKEIRDKAVPFINWLKEASEDEDSD